MANPINIAYVHILSGEIICITITNEEGSTGEYGQPSDATYTTINPHLDTTVTYELVDGVITAVSESDIIDRMNDPNDTTVVIPSE
jgi:hypothetical protein